MRRSFIDRTRLFTSIERHVPLFFLIACVTIGLVVSRFLWLNPCVTIPASAAFLVTVLSLILYRSKLSPYRYGMRVGHGLCLTCGYDLRESVGRCPECGRSIDEWIYGSMGSRETKRIRRSLLREREL